MNPTSPHTISSTTLLRRIAEAVEDALVHAEARLRRKLPRPDRIELMQGRTAGQCLTSNHWRGQYVLRINEQAARDHWEVVRDETIPHELSHMIVRLKHGSGVQPHGLEWQWTMRDVFDLEPSRTHELPLARARHGRQRRFLYRCDCGRHYRLSTTRHNRLRRNPAHYVCASCRGRLDFVQPLDG